MQSDRQQGGRRRVDAEAPSIQSGPLQRVKDWLLLDCNRYVLAAGILAVGFVVLVSLESVGLISTRGDSIALLYVFQSLVAGNVTLITIAISINQLVLSRELRSPRELKTELDAAEEYRQAVEEETERSVIPEDPHDFLRILVENTWDHVEALDAQAITDDRDLREEIDDLRANMVAELDRTDGRLRGSSTGVFPALSTILNADFGSRINHIRWIREAYPDALSDRERAALSGIEQRLEHLDIAREYFKSIYLQQELADVSKLMVYVGLVAELIAVSFLIVLGYAGRGGPLRGHELLVPLAITVNFAPLVLLSVHVLRIATVARRTTAITPFITPT